MIIFNHFLLFQRISGHSKRTIILTSWKSNPHKERFKTGSEENPKYLDSTVYLSVIILQSELYSTEAYASFDLMLF